MTNANAIRWILCCGRRRLQASQHGRAHGGRGRPGWHIECKGDGDAALGQRIEFMEAAPIWLSRIMLARLRSPSTIVQGAVSRSSGCIRAWLSRMRGKMSKSLGNLTLSKAIWSRNYTPDAIRVTLLSHHYRYPWECFRLIWRRQQRLLICFAHIRQLVGRNAEGEDLDAAAIASKRRWEEDMNTPAALELLHHAAKQVAVNQDVNTGAEILRLTTMLGLCGCKISTHEQHESSLILGLGKLGDAPSPPPPSPPTPYMRPLRGGRGRKSERGLM